MIELISSKNAVFHNRFRPVGTFVRAVRRSFLTMALLIGGVQAVPAVAADQNGAGGPYEAMDSKDNSASKADPSYRALFLSWKRLDQFQQGAMAIPSQRPIQQANLSSGFGVRSDPFRGGAAMHAGVDMPGPIGTPIYATADGHVGRAGWANGYGNLVELEHGKGLETRYGHLSAILVQPGQRVRRGDLIARMGSTGRSTGSHLHYEVRMDGHAINPIPFLETSGYIVEVARRSDGTQIAVGGPDN
ncbi:MAG: peptidase [Sphingomonas bacterium]|nr:M23 family metallopeptidase [Sphingomonas bacterium]MDB5689513.1 peptidase [Sphingomonas bacterium]